MVLLLVAIAVMALVAAGSVTVGQALSRRSAEQALLVMGNAFRLALVNYRAADGGTGLGPGDLADLLRDPRVPNARRFLRRIYEDPLTGKQDWGVIRGPDGRIEGVYSLAAGRPIKRTGFELDQQGFDNAEKYADWVFGVRAPVLAPSGVSASGLPPRR